MYTDKKILALIPARGGSQGLPGKNIRPIAGKPMIAHSIEKALTIKEIDRLVVSTDDPVIAQVAKQYGAEVPFLRDETLARDDTPMVPVIIDALTRLEEDGDKYDYALMLQANSPLSLSSDIMAVIHKIVDNDFDVVFTVCAASHPPQWTLKLENSEPILAFQGLCNTSNYRRQDDEVLYRSTGAVFAVNVNYLFNNAETARLCLPATGQRSFAMITDSLSAVDIDTDLDFLLAETIFTKIAGNKT